MSSKVEPWQITAARFCVENSSRGFTVTQLTNYLRSLNIDFTNEHNQIDFFFSEEILSPGGSRFQRSPIAQENGYVYQAPLALVQKIQDYDELVEARKNSRNAIYFALASIVLACISIIVQVVNPVAT